MVLSLFLAAALASDVSQPSATPVEPIGVTVSGGVSLGSWEAGFMYLYLEGQKARPQSQVRIVTGASAGSANALVSAISSCRAPNPYPMQDPGWRVWGPVGFNQLFDRRRASEEALFVRDALDASFERVRAV